MSSNRTWIVVGVALLCGGPIGLAAEEGPLHAAARRGDLARVAALLAEDPALVHARAADGATPLHAAAAGRRVGVIRLLLACGARVNAVDGRGLTPLHIAATSNDGKLVAALLEAGADVNAADANGDTPLHMAARRLAAEPMRRLLAAGATVNARNRQGRTPLHVLGSASRTQAQLDALYDQLRGLLLEYGADPKLPAGAAGGGDDHSTRDGYRTWPEIEQLMQTWANTYPQICELHDLGLTVQGRHIWALRVTDNPAAEEDEPEFKYVSTMHGDEWTGCEMSLFFIEHLLTSYGADPRVTRLIDEVDLWVVPVMNPDGFVVSNRGNARGVDLNRNFPEGTRGDENTTDGREPETAAVMNWTFANSFTLSANFHAGALVVNYPYDNDGLGDTYSPTPDDDMFIWISEEYARHNPPMWNSPYFYHGITNGADWYAISGGMQDWNYRYMGDNEVTIELSNNKRPPYSQIPQYWDDNRESMLAYVETCLIGVRGIVTAAQTGAPLSARVSVVGRAHQTYTDPDVGDYHRMLLPGLYALRYEADGYDPRVVANVAVGPGDATRLDVELGPPALVTFPNGGEVLYAGEPTMVTWTGDPTAQFHVQYTDNYGDLEAVFDGFEDGDLGPEYDTGGDADWFVTSASAHSGSRSAAAGDVDDNQRSWLTRTVSGGELRFWYRVSSEADYDFFSLYIDGQRKLHVSGFTGWTQYATTLPEGTHELKWEYVKDGSVSSGGDTVWIDDLEITADHTAWTDIVELTGPGEMAVAWTPPAPGADYKVRVRAYYGDGYYGWWDESDGTFEVVAGNPDGDLNGDGCVDQADLGILLASFGIDEGGDLDGDGDTDQADLGILLANWGAGCG